MNPYPDPLDTMRIERKKSWVLGKSYTEFRELTTVFFNISEYPNDITNIEGVLWYDPTLGINSYEEDESWFWSDEWQAKEREADEDFNAGRFVKANTIDEVLAILNAPEKIKEKNKVKRTKK